MGNRVLVVGSSVVDLSFYTERIPVVGETVTGRFAQGLGGKGFNQAVASALSGTPTSFLSAVGDFNKDAFAPQFANRLAELGIEFAFEQIPSEATGAAAISIDREGRNNIIVSLGANAALSTGFLERHSSYFQNIDVLLLQFETNFSATECALSLARKISPLALRVLNPAPALEEIPISIMNQVDLLTPNETELEEISGIKITSEDDLKVACQRVKGPKAILATLGERGCYYFSKEQIRRYPAFKVKATDTTGAGDAFNGGLASGWVKYGGDVHKAIEFASAVAGISVERPGTSASMPTEGEILSFLVERPENGISTTLVDSDLR